MPDSAPTASSSRLRSAAVRRASTSARCVFCCFCRPSMRASMRACTSVATSDSATSWGFTAASSSLSRTGVLALSTARAEYSCDTFTLSTRTLGVRATRTLRAPASVGAASLLSVTRLATLSARWSRPWTEEYSRVIVLFRLAGVGASRRSSRVIHSSLRTTLPKMVRIWPFLACRCSKLPDLLSMESKPGVAASGTDIRRSYTPLTIGRESLLTSTFWYLWPRSPATRTSSLKSPSSRARLS